MAEDHDKTHRLLFSFPRMVEDLIRLCLGGEWVERLDFSTLEKVPERLLSETLTRREQDLLWRLRYTSPEPGGASQDDNWFYVYFHLEHERKGRKYMVLDVLEYRLLIWKELARHRKTRTPSGKLPPILTLVFYTGDKPATMATSLAEVVEPVPGAPPELFDPTRIVVVDAAHDALPASGGTPSPLVDLLRFHRLNEIGELDQVTSELAGMLGDPEDEGLRRAFVTFINAVVLPQLEPKGIAAADRIRIIDLEEVPSMLAGIRQMTQNWEHQGWLRGQARLLLEQLEWRFGEVPGWARERVEAAESPQLRIWARRLLEAESLGDVFAD